MESQEAKPEVNLAQDLLDESRNRLSSILESITRQSVGELCRLPCPPQMIKNLGSVILLLFGYEDDSWKAFTRELKSYSRFIEKLSTLQVDQVDQSTVQKTGQISSIVELNHRLMESKSLAAKNLSRWAVTFIRYWRDYQNIQQFAQLSREYEENH